MVNDKQPCIAPSSNGSPSVVQAEEMLVHDVRAGVTPAQMVERKLGSLLRDGSRLVSHMQVDAGLMRRQAASSKASRGSGRVRGSAG